MEVLSPKKEEHFDFNRFSYLSAPSSPKRFGEAFYLSAPTSPSRFYAQFEDDDDDDDGFAFPVNREQDSSPRSAGELFDDGIIKPLESDNSDLLSPLLSPNRVKQSSIAKGKKAIAEAFSSTNKNDSSSIQERRGRDRTLSSEFSTSKSGRRIIRSESPSYRKPQYAWIEQQQQQKQSKQSEAIKEESAESVPTSHSWRSSRIWRLKDFLLFRSASEGRGTSKDPYRKFPVSYSKKSSEEGKGNSTSMFRSNIPKPRRKEAVVSAHELHYNRKKAENEDLKKKTFLPYKQGILGKLAGLGSSTR